MAQIARVTRETVTTGTESFTATRAKQTLDAQPAGWRNRPVRANLIEKFSQDMIAGRWEFNGESIVIGPDNEVIDGQHRLLALVKAPGVTIRSVVVRGMPPRVFSSMNQGGKRSGGDVLAIAGAGDVNVRNGQIGIVWRYRNGLIANPGKVPPVTVLMEYYENEKGLGDSLQIAYRCRALVGVSLAAGLHFLFAEKDRVLADAFFESFASGEGLREGDPVLSLRKRLIEHRGRRIQVRSPLIAAWIIKSWNAVRAGRSLRYVRWNPGEEFPAID